MNSLPEVKPPPNRPATTPMPAHEKELMQQHLRDENLPEAVMPAMPVSKVLKGQKALVTGANSGIGKAVALSLARAGADVIASSPQSNRTVSTARHCRFSAKDDRDIFCKFFVPHHDEPV